jgi:thiol-disulfide isomerase/thioredoxin
MVERRLLMALVLICGCIAQQEQTATSATEHSGYVVVMPAETTTSTLETQTTVVYPNSVSETTSSLAPATTTLPPPKTTFMDTGGAICAIDGKPIVRMYSKNDCEHCKWSGPTFREVSGEYEGKGLIVAHQWEFGTEDDMLHPGAASIPQQEERYFFSENPSKSVPFFSFGCRFQRVGNGYYIRDRKDLEGEEFRALLGYLVSSARNTST